MKRIYAPYSFDWCGNENDSEAWCTKCELEYETRYAIREKEGELLQYFSHLCPGCGSLDHIFGVSSPPERMIL